MTDGALIALFVVALVTVQAVWLRRRGEADD